MSQPVSRQPAANHALITPSPLAAPAPYTHTDPAQPNTPGPPAPFALQTAADQSAHPIPAVPWAAVLPTLGSAPAPHPCPPPPPFARSCLSSARRPPARPRAEQSKAEEKDKERKGEPVEVKTKTAKVYENRTETAADRFGHVLNRDEYEQHASAPRARVSRQSKVSTAAPLPLPLALSSSASPFPLLPRTPLPSSARNPLPLIPSPHLLIHSLLSAYPSPSLGSA